MSKTDKFNSRVSMSINVITPSFTIDSLESNYLNSNHTHSINDEVEAETQNHHTESTSSQTLKARAPAKIILSGEHSVVYGSDAIAVAIQRYTHVSLTPRSQSKVINTLFSGLSSSVVYPINALSKLKHILDDRFDGYTKGELPVQNILNHPNDLAMYALSTLMQQLPSRKSIADILPRSGILRSESNIPIGAGMGSSASAIAATLVLYEDILQKPMSLEQRFELIRFCERLQHGKGSAIDAATVTFGGVNHIHEQQHKTTDVTLDNDWYWIHTGIPQSSTGECVSQVRKNHGTDSLLWREFNTITNAIIQDLHHEQSPKASIKENQQLLNSIGVVSNTANTVIQLIETHGGAAKVSGAGTVTGEKNGLILAYLPKETFNHDSITQLMNNINLQCNNFIKDWGELLVDYEGAVRVRN